MARLTYQQRKKLPKSSFVFPSKKGSSKGGRKSNPAGRGGYPIPDISHARNALARVSRFGTPAEKAAVRRKVYAKYPQLRKRKKG